jgi:hypothetical protein
VILYSAQRTTTNAKYATTFFYHKMRFFSDSILSFNHANSKKEQFLIELK